MTKMTKLEDRDSVKNLLQNSTYTSSLCSQKVYKVSKRFIENCGGVYTL